MSVGVIGGGIAGLSALWQLRGDGVDAVLYEAAAHVGGKLGASDVAGLSIAEGADAFLARVPDGIELARELGLEAELISPAAGQAEIWTRVDGVGRLRRLPRPNVLGVPLDPASVAELIGPEAAADLQLDLDRTAADPVRADDTIGSLVRRRLGDRIHEALVDPLLGAINAGATDRLSLHASSPQLLAGASRSPSLVRGLQELTAGRRSDAPVFHSFLGGPGVLIDALSARLDDSIRVGTRIAQLACSDTGIELYDETGRSVGTHRSLVLAQPASGVDGLVAEVAPGAGDALSQIPFVSVSLVTLAWSQASLPAALAALDPAISGFLVPRTDPLRITACSWASTKWPHLGGDHVIARVSVGHRDDQQTCVLPDDELTDVVLRDLGEAIGDVGRPTAARVSRWPGAFPQYEVGHLERIAAARQELAEHRLFVAGMSYDGIGIPASIRSGRDAARAAAGRM